MKRILCGSRFFGFSGFITLGNVCDELPCDFRLGCACQLVRSAIIKQHDLIVVRADRVLREIGDHQRDFLFAPLGIREFMQLLALRRKADAEGRFRQRRDPRQDVGVGHEL